MQFGSIDIDSRLIQAREVVDGVEIVDSLNGCACCTVRGDLMDALMKLVSAAWVFCTQESCLLQSSVTPSVGA